MFGFWSQNALKFNLRGCKFQIFWGHAPDPTSFGMLCMQVCSTDTDNSYKYMYIHRHGSEQEVCKFLSDAGM